MNAKKLVAAALAAATLAAFATGCAATADDAGSPEADTATTASPLKVGTDDWKNCELSQDLNTFDCVARNQGTDLPDYELGYYTFMSPGKEQTVTFTNIGPVRIAVSIQQFWAQKYIVTVAPGETVQLGALDQGWFMYSIVVSRADDTPFDGVAKARIHYGTFSPAHTQCNDTCMTQFEGCIQGCGLNDHGNGWCAGGCTNGADMCLNACTAQGN